MALRGCALELRLFPHDQTEEGITAERLMLRQTRALNYMWKAQTAQREAECQHL